MRYLLSIFYLLCVIFLLGFIWHVLPVEYRTNIAILNMGVVFLICLGALVKLGGIFTAIGEFGENIHLLSVYLWSFSIFSVVALAIIIVACFFGANFKLQLLLHCINFFLFLDALGIGLWLCPNFHKVEIEQKSALASVRDMQARCARLKVLLEALPDSHFLAKQNFSKICDDVNCLSGALSVQVGDADARILRVLSELETEVNGKEYVDAEKLNLEISVLKTEIEIRRKL